MGCFYCDAHHEGREAIMLRVGEMKAGVLYLFKDQSHRGRCVLALKTTAGSCASARRRSWRILRTTFPGPPAR